MKMTCTVVALGLMLASPLAFALETQTYQVTGPVVEINNDVIVVQKGKEKWEIARNSETKIGKKFKAKVGDKITVRYRMTATSVEPKSETTMTSADPANADKPAVKAAAK